MRIPIVVLLLFATRARAQTGVQATRLIARAALPTIALKVWNPAGHIRFVGWDKDSVVVRGALSPSDRLVVSGRADAMKFFVEARRQDGEAHASELTVYMPRRGNISVKAASADIAADDVSGWFYTVSGSIRLGGQATSIEAESMTGSLDLNVSTPWLHARTGSGSMLLRGAPQDADVATIDGTLSIAAPAVLRGQFASVAGDIHYAGAPAAGAIFEFSDHSGSVDLRMPAATSAALALSTINGAIEDGLSRVQPASSNSRTARIRLGRGEAQITVRTFKGSIRLRQQ
jgi:hypothetical protein